MTDQHALAVAEAFLDAFTHQDFATAATHLATEFTFDGPIAHYRSAREFLDGAPRFAARLAPRRTPIAAFGDDRTALLLYDLHLIDGSQMRVADHFTVDGDEILSEAILWDTGGAR